MTDSTNDFFKEIEKINNRRNTFLGRIEIFYWAVRRGLRTAWKSPYRIKWWYQRARYGYSDRDAWSGDWHIAGVIAGIMEKIVNEGHGVAMSYAEGDWDTPVDVMIERRDAEWNKYIAIFREYSKNGPAINQEWKDDFGGVLDEDMQDALQWLSKHFQELWD
jgi:hypothetical protein